MFQYIDKYTHDENVANRQLGDIVSVWNGFQWNVLQPKPK